MSRERNFTPLTGSALRVRAMNNENAQMRMTRREKRASREEFVSQNAHRAEKVLFDNEGKPTPLTNRMMLKALTSQRTTVMKNLQRMRRRYPNDTPQQLGLRIEKLYLQALTGAGAGAGAVSLVPGLGTVAGLGVSAGATIAFLELSALYAQSIAELHGYRTHEDEGSQALVMAILLGKDGRKILRQAGSYQKDTGSLASTALNLTTGGGLKGIVFDKLKQSFMKRMIASQGASFLGRLLPFGLGALVGGAANHKLGMLTVESTDVIFGEYPTTFTDEIEDLAVLDAEIISDEDLSGLEDDIVDAEVIDETP